MGPMAGLLQVVVTVGVVSDFHAFQVLSVISMLFRSIFAPVRSIYTVDLITHKSKPNKEKS